MSDQLDGSLLGLLSGIAVLILILSGYAGRAGGLSKALRMLAGGALIAALMALLALVAERISG
jgi:hypothetical protein